MGESAENSKLGSSGSAETSKPQARDAVLSLRSARLRARARARRGPRSAFPRIASGISERTGLARERIRQVAIQYTLKGPCGVNLKGLLKVWDGARHTLFPVAGIWRSAPYRSCRLPAPRRYFMRQHMILDLIAGPTVLSLPPFSSEASQRGSFQACRLRSATPGSSSAASRLRYLFSQGRPRLGLPGVAPRLRV